MASGFAALQNDGCYREPTCIIRIEDSQGGLIYTSEPEEEDTDRKSKKNEADGTRIYKSNAARMMTDMLQTVMTEGTARGLGLGDMPSAGKTGTTNDNKDGLQAIHVTIRQVSGLAMTSRRRCQGLRAPLIREISGIII